MKVPAKIPAFVKLFYPEVVWKMPSHENAVYLTFDDGPTPNVTPWVMAVLEKFNAKATFFLIGNNVEKHPEILVDLRAAGHSIGNHTHNHEKGWTTNNKAYVQSVAKTHTLLNTPLFRPPYGRIKKSQIALLKNQYKIIMWDVLSHDYNPRNSPQECVVNVLNNVEAGSIIVFHDSQKAWPNLQYCLPLVLAELKNRGFVFRAL